MKIKMKTMDCGPQGNFAPGTVRTVDEAEGRALVDGGFAESLDVPDPAGEPAKGKKLDDKKDEKKHDKKDDKKDEKKDAPKSDGTTPPA